MSEKYILVGWFNAHNDYHGFQQVHRDFEGQGDTFPLFCRASDFLKTGLDEVRQSTAGEIAPGYRTGLTYGDGYKAGLAARTPKGREQ